jgi:hypothetical protein
MGARSIAGGVACLLFTLLFASCATMAPPGTPELVSVSASSAAYPWVRQVYDCTPSSVAVKISDPDTSDISLRLGDPTDGAAPAFKIGTDDLLVVVDRRSAVGALSSYQVRQLFSGQVTQWKDVGGSDLAVQVWTYSPAEDIQLLFDRLVMQGQPITSLARLAVSAQAMSDGVAGTPGSVGLLPRRWKAGNTSEALSVASAPVLALTRSAPQGPILQILSCLQSGK